VIAAQPVTTIPTALAVPVRSWPRLGSGSRSQGDDPALVRKAVATYQKLQELEAENPHLPSEYLQWLQQLYAPIIASISSDS